MASVLLACCLLVVGSCGDPEAPDSDGDGAAAGPPPPNVVLWLVDTLRADRTSAYGYERDTTPFLAELAADGVLFENFHVHNNWTTPSVATILTGRLPLTFTADYRQSLPESLTTAAEWYWEQGYTTASFSQSIASSAVMGFDSGYDHFDYSTKRRHPRARPNAPLLASEHLVHTFADWVENDRDTDRPFFAYLHTLDPHIPLHVHEGHPSFVDPDYAGPWDGSINSFAKLERTGVMPDAADRQYLSDLYDTEVRYFDAQLEVLVERLEAAGVRENTLLVIVSDHGEELYERGERGHAHDNLYAELTHVPLVLSWPAGLESGRRVPRLVGAIDLLPTLLDLCGVDPLPDADGSSMVPWVEGRGADAEPVDELVQLTRNWGPETGMVGVRTPDALGLLKLRGKKRGLRVYDLATDPDSRKDISATRPGFTRTVRTRMQEWRQLREQRESEYPTVTTEPMDEETRARLEALGYLNGAVGDDPVDGH